MICGEHKTKVAKRLKRIAGQVNGLQKMVDDDRYCVDILTQIAAVRSALDAVGAEVLAQHISGCMLANAPETQHAEAQNKTPQELETELRTLLSRLLA